MKITIVAPAFDEERRIIPFLKELYKYKFPIVVVDDGSSDKTVEKLKAFSKKNKKVKILKHKINIGKGAALKTGCIYAFKNGADAVVLMDSDGQHNPSDLYKFEDKLNEGYDVVIGSRNLGYGVPFDRYIGNKIASVIIALLFKVYVSDLICGFRALTKKAFRKIDWESRDYGVEVETVIKMRKRNLKHCEVPVETIYYDGFKGVSFLDAFGVFGRVISWKFRK